MRDRTEIKRVFNSLKISLLNIAHKMTNLKSIHLQAPFLFKSKRLKLLQTRGIDDPHQIDLR